jgi:hypothetical protein
VVEKRYRMRWRPFSMCGWHSGILAVGMRGAGKDLHHVHAGELLQRARVGDLVDAAADEQVPGQRAGGRVLDHLVDLQLAVAGSGLQEVVVGQVLDQIAGAEDVVARPRDLT